MKTIPYIAAVGLAAAALIGGPLMDAPLMAAPLGAQEGTLLVVNKSDSSLSFIDGTTGREVDRVATGFAPHEVAVSADGRWAYVTDYGTGPRPGNTVT